MTRGLLMGTRLPDCAPRLANFVLLQFTIHGFAKNQEEQDEELPDMRHCLSVEATGASGRIVICGTAAPSWPARTAKGAHACQNRRDHPQCDK